MAKTYYETLGVSPGAKSSEIKAAYRQLVLKHHPDRNADPAAPQVFRGIAEAFETLGDPALRRRYDDSLAADARRARENAERLKREEEQRRTRVQEPVVQTSPQPKRVEFKDPDLPDLLKRLSSLFNSQRFADAETLARRIIEIDPRRALPYAVLGDISRARGGLDDAARMYSFALQMEPTNPLFLRRYEEILDRSQVQEGRGHRVTIEPQEKRAFAVLAIVAITLLGCVYVVLSPEKPLLQDAGPISSWTVGMMAMLFLSGTSAGAALSVANLVDRVDSSSSGKMASTLLWGLIAIFSFPVSAICYSILGLSQRAFSITTTRMFATVAAITTSLSLAGAVSSAEVSFLQTLLWGGNLVFLGALAGWTVADNLRR